MSEFVGYENRYGSPRVEAGARGKDCMTQCLVIDLGAGSGRAMLARYDGQHLALTEIHRFGGYAVERADGPHWDAASLLAEIEAALRLAQSKAGGVDSIGVDSWGLDYALYDAADRLLGEPYHYRHPRSQRGYDACRLEPASRFAATGAQDLPVNTIHQLADEAEHQPDRHAAASRLLMMADVVNHHLTGAFRSEVTLARTSGLFDAQANRWNGALCARLGIPARLLQPPIYPGDTYGVLRADLAVQAGIGRVPVLAVAAHDTASAVAALGVDDGSGFLICGSWSLIGVEQARIDTRPAVFAAGFGNEGGVEGRPFLVKSLNGLHLIQKLRDAWERRTGEAVTFAELSRRAAVAPDMDPSIDPTDALFFNPPDIIAAVSQFLIGRGEVPPCDLGGLARAVYEGLAREAGAAVTALETLLDRRLPALKVCGGGAQDAVLTDMVAAATKKPLRVGPIEASAWGNALLQLIGLGVVKTLDEGRRLVERSANFHDLVRTS